MVWDIGNLTSQQKQLVMEAIGECSFNWNHLLPGLNTGNQWSRPGKVSIPVTCRDLSTFNGAITHHPQDDYSGYHAIKVDELGNVMDEHNEVAAAGVLGLFWFDGRVEVEQSLVNNPALFKEVFLSEGAHAVDFYYLWPNYLRNSLYDIYHPNGPDSHGHFEGAYFDMVGEAFMGGFVYATTNKPPSLLGFSHVTTKLISDKIKPLLKIGILEPPVINPTGPTLRDASKAEFEAEFNRRYGFFKDISIGFTGTEERWNGKFIP